MFDIKQKLHITKNITTVFKYLIWYIYSYITFFSSNKIQKKILRNAMTIVIVIKLIFVYLFIKPKLITN